VTLAHKLALVDSDGAVGPNPLAAAAIGLAEQIQNEFAAAWGRTASVTPIQKGFPVPLECWPIFLRREIGEPGALGVHLDEHHQPYALVDVDAGDWTVTASHEALEMLADPWGNRLWTASAPMGWTGAARVRYLIEVADPCEAFTYPSGGVAVSDFVLPNYYRSAGGRRATHLGTCSPRQVREGGYISWVNPADGTWHQRFVGRNGNVRDISLGRADPAAKSLRSWIDAQARKVRTGTPERDEG
jgi:hypothetical protein